MHPALHLFTPKPAPVCEGRRWWRPGVPAAGSGVGVSWAWTSGHRSLTVSGYLSLCRPLLVTPSRRGYVQREAENPQSRRYEKRWCVSVRCCESARVLNAVLPDRRRGAGSVCDLTALESRFAVVSPGSVFLSSSRILGGVALVSRPSKNKEGETQFSSPAPVRVASS